MAKKPLTITAPERPAPAATPKSAQPIYELSTVTLDEAPSSVALPPEAAMLTDQLRELAVRVLGARRRLGDALLDACRWLSEARAAAEEGQWYVFLRVTGTSPDSAENLLNIHARVRQNTAFAEKIRSGWLNQTVAGELAKPATPPEVLQQLLERAEPPRVVDVKRARRILPQARDAYHIVDNPNYSGSPPVLSAPLDSDIAQAGQTTLAALLAEVATSLEAIAAQAHTLSSDEDTRQTLSRIKAATEAIQHHVSAAE